MRTGEKRKRHEILQKGLLYRKWKSQKNWRESKAKAVFKEIMAENFSKVISDV